MSKIKSDILWREVSDNMLNYFSNVVVFIEHADPECFIQIRKTTNGIIFHITPSVLDFKDDIINNILLLHRILKMKTNFSKSTKISKSISFTIEY